MAARVQQAADELGYRPSRVARSLRNRSARVWGLICVDIRDHFFTKVVRGIEDVAWKQGYSVVLCNSDNDVEKERTYLELIHDERMAGCILTPADTTTDASVLTNAGIPVVAVDQELSGVPHDEVRLDNHEAAAQATRHLVLQGFERIACISGPIRWVSGRERADGYRDVVGAENAVVVHEVWSDDGGYRAMQTLLRHDPLPDALLAGNSVLLLGAARAIQDANLKLADFGLIGFDDVPFGDLVDPPLSTVEQPTYEIGKTAAELLAARIDGDDSPAKTITLPSILRVRGSSVRRSPGEIHWTSP